MDAEGRRWGTPEARDTHLRQLQNIVQAEVRAQGGRLTQNELDILVQVRTWGAQKYELANFTDDELETALIAVSPEISERSILRGAIAYTRSRNLDIDVVFQRMQWPVAKLALARELLPVLLGKLYVEVDAHHDNVPVIELVHHINGLVHRLSGGGFQLESPIALEG